MKGFAALGASLIIRREPPKRPPEPLSQALLEALDDRTPHLDQPHQLDRAGHQQAPSISLTADLISAGRAAYRAERQRQAQKIAGLSPHGEVLSPLLFRPDGPVTRPTAAMLRDVARPAPLSPYAPPTAMPPTPVAEARPAVAPAAPLRSLVPPRPATEPAAAARAELETPARRRAVTLRLRPEQHARLLAVRRQIGCSFQVLVVRALSDHLAILERRPAEPRPAPVGAGGFAGESIAVIDLAAVLASDAGAHGHRTPDVHFFTLPSGWYVATWRQQRGANAATPSEVLGQVLKDHGVVDLIKAEFPEAVDSVLESVSLGEGGHRLALTIRLEPDLHLRLLGTRDRLGRTGQDILLDSINAYLGT